MDVSLVQRKAFAFSAFLALLAACSSVGPQPFVPNNATRAAMQPSRSVRDRSWVLPGIVGSLLYMTDGSNVDMISTKTWTKVGALAVAAPTLCSDAAQDVILPTGGKIQIYPHAGTKPLRTLKDSGGSAFSCASDPATGDLAVVNNATPGNVVIYTGGVGKGKQYNIENAASILFATYDDKGDLFVDARTTTTVSTSSFIAELQKGASAFKPFHLNFSISSPFGMQWDGKYLAIMNTRAFPKNIIYQFSVSGFNGTKVGSTTLNDDGETYQFCIAKFGTFSRLFSTDYAAEDVRLYAYPAGGNSLRKIKPSSSVGGVAVSLKPK